MLLAGEDWAGPRPLAAGPELADEPPPSEDGGAMEAGAVASETYRPLRAEAMALVALVRDTVAAGVQRQALLLRLSALRRDRRARHAGLLREALAPLRRHPRIRVTTLPNGDVIAVGGAWAKQLDTAYDALRAMLEEELAPVGTGEWAAAGPLVRRLRLPEEAVAVLAAVETALGLTAAEAAATGDAGFGFPAVQPLRMPLDGASLAAAERALATVDLTPFLRRQTICRLPRKDGAGPELLWEERRVSLPEVAAALLPWADLDAAPRLAHRLRRALDRRLLAGLARPEELRDLRRPLLLPLALDSVTAPEFLRFDALLPSGLRAEGGLAVALPAEDVLRDPAGYAFARDFLCLRGHRVVLDLPAPALAALLPVVRARFDLLRLDGPAAQAAARSRAAALLAAEPERVVLAGVERSSTIAWGWEMGITLFQGRLVERRSWVPG